MRPHDESSPELAERATGRGPRGRVQTDAQQRNHTPERVLARALLHVLSDMKMCGEDGPGHLEDANAFAIFMAEHSERLASSSE